ncbi:CsbD family protein [Methylobacterium sp. P1-11]|nr:CsbD family protein [Methylobacterium sp. P1-11]
MRGSVKEAVGALTGGARTETEGRRQKRGACAAKTDGAGPVGSGHR